MWTSRAISPRASPWSEDLRLSRLPAFLQLWVPVIAWMAVIFFLSAQSSLPTVPDSILDALFKKSAHALAYAILCPLAARAFHAGQLFRWRRLAAALLISALYGVSDELHQSLVPGRSPRVFDWLVDVAGAAAGAWLYARTRHYPAPPTSTGPGAGRT